jgi:hypothetical protein
MKRVICNNSSQKAVHFMLNGGDPHSIIVTAEQWDSYNGQFSYWFSVGHFKTLNGAKKSAIRQMKELGYTFSENSMNFKGVNL